ncbi:MAG: autotransporter strand-loop-strand O-heptosyltransferase, partial [Kiritimatiellae bacterium]|nr:autotransporter strand-loop-strand O-heptosyltransferase [Kiritimatiellia bacterium]
MANAKDENEGRAKEPQSASNAQADPFHIPPPEVPTQEGPRGIRYDFNDGARVLLPPGAWHVQIEDDESGNILFACDADGGWVLSAKKYYVPFRIRVWDRADLQTPVLDHLMDLRGRPVLIKFPVGTIGDILGWFPYAEKFRRKHGCALECAMAKNLVELFAPQYPELAFSVAPDARTAAPYASYRIGLFFGGDQDNQPFDFRQVGLARTAGYILGVDPQETPPRLPP